MRVRFLALRLAVPALLVGLVVLLATLQYRWLGQVSEAEREQLQRSLTQRAREFADDFDREITGLYRALQSNADPRTAEGGAAVSAALDTWRETARFPRIVRALYLADPAGEEYNLRPFDPASSTFAAAPVAWPANLTALKERLRTSSPQGMGRPPGMGAGQLVTISTLPQAADVPAIVIPVSSPPAAGGATTTPDEPAAESRISGSAVFRGGDVAFRGTASDVLTRNAVRLLQAPRTYLVVELDIDQLRNGMIPALVARHFPESDSTRYTVAVRSGDGTVLHARGLAPGVTLDPKSADATASFFWVRPDVVRLVAAPLVSVASGAAPGSSGADAAGFSVVPAPGPEPQQLSIYVQQYAVNDKTAGADGQVATLRRTMLPAAGWQVLLRHSAGSLDLAVAQARRRNLGLSFGILAVLAAGVMLVVVNAQRAQRLAARQMDFVATVTHELRTPLAVIRSAAENLSAGVVGEPARARTYGDLIDKEGRRLTDMVEQVLAYAGLEAGRAPRMTQRVDLSHLLDGVLDACQPLCSEAGITVEFDAESAAGAPPVTGDEAGLRLAIQNLVSNAVKHGADGRWLGVTVTAATHHGRDETRITVSDRGRGIDAAELAHVFEPFYRGRRALDDQVRGNGLGLSLVKRIVEAHGGRVAVQSTPGTGAIFTISLPAAGEEAHA